MAWRPPPPEAHCIAPRNIIKKEERERKMAELQRGSDAQKERFCKGRYQTIGNWLYSGIFPPLILVPLPPARDRSVRLTWAIQRLMHTLTGDDVP